ncbi:MAG: RNase H family protein [Bacteroidales bacterium]
MPEQKNLASIVSDFYSSLSVDAACSGNPGIMEYKGVQTWDGTPIFKMGPFPDATNNIGEFLALVHALSYLNSHGFPNTPIYSDSITAIAWVRKQKANTKIQATEKNENLLDLVRRAETWLRTHPYKNPIRKWQTEKWGEIPADFGRKK